MGDAGEVAEYAHASLYTFNQKARAAVIQATMLAMSYNGAVKIWYEPAQEVCYVLRYCYWTKPHADPEKSFRLQCPSQLGSAADEALGKEIAQYIAAAECGEQEPTIQRFPGSRFDGLDAFDDADVDADEATRVTEDVKCVTHLIVARQTTGKLVRLFCFSELPREITERMLVPKSDKLARLFQSGQACRSTQWYDQDNCYVFNGRTAGVQMSSEVANYEELELPQFPILVDRRRAPATTLAPKPAPKSTDLNSWEYVGKPPGITEWLMGVGETRQIEPDEKPEIPRDAKKLLASAQLNTSGRPRVVKGAQLIPEEVEVEPEVQPSEADQIQLEVDFQALLAGKFVPLDDDEIGSQSAASEKTTTPPSWQALMSNTKPAEPAKKVEVVGLSHAIRGENVSTGERPSLPVCTSSARRDEVIGNDRSNEPLTSRNVLESREELFPSYDKSYAQVDGIGLTSNAAATAEWELRGLAHRPFPAESDLNTRASALSSVNAPTRFSSIKNSDRDWVNRVVMPQPSVEKLIDDTVPEASTPRAVSSRRGMSPSNACEARPAYNRLGIPNQQGSDEEIIETIQKPTPNFVIKRNTMSQKAKRQHKGRDSSKATGLKPELPLPDPLPAPKPKKRKDKTSGVANEQQQPQNPVKVPSAKDASKELETTPHWSIINPHYSFGQLLLQMRQPPHDPDDEDLSGGTRPQIKLISQIGIVSTRSTDKNVSKIGLAPATLEKQLNQATALRSDFTPRLSSCDTDAAGLLRSGVFDKRSYYEIFFRDNAAGSLLKLVVDDKQQYKVTAMDRQLGEAFVHYPEHIYDARYRLLDSGIEQRPPSSEGIEQFMLSMQTDEDVPSFRAAMRAEFFTIEKVFTRQVFSQQLEGMTFRVSRVMDLWLESSNDQSHNFRAVAFSNSDMVEHQRLWWEVMWESCDLSQAEKMEVCVEERVRSMDSVGMNNKGLFVHTDLNSSKAAKTVEQDVWYW